MFAQIAAGLGIGQIAIYVIIIAAIVAIVYVALQRFGIAIPPLFVRVFWILVTAVVCILAVRFLLSL